MKVNSIRRGKSFFQKRCKKVNHLTASLGTAADYFVIPKKVMKNARDVKVTIVEERSLQHKLISMDFKLKDRVPISAVRKIKKSRKTETVEIKRKKLGFENRNQNIGKNKVTTSSEYPKKFVGYQKEFRNKRRHGGGIHK